MEEKNMKPKRKKYTDGDIQVIGRETIRTLKSGVSDFPDEQNDLSPAEFGRLLGYIKSKWTGDSVSQAQFRSLLSIMGNDLPAKIWRKVYINAIRLSDCMKLDDSERITLVKDVLLRYGKYPDELQAFSDELLDSSRLFRMVLENMLEEGGDTGVGTSSIAHAWATAFQPLLAKRARDDYGRQVVSQEDADAIIERILQMESNAGPSGLSVDYLNLLPLLFLHSSERGRHILSETKLGKRLGIGVFIRDPATQDKLQVDSPAGSSKEYSKKMTDDPDIHLVEQLIHVLMKSIDSIRKVPYLQRKLDQSEGGRKEAEETIRHLEHRIEDITSQLEHQQQKKLQLMADLEREREKVREAEQAEHHVVQVAEHEITKLRENLVNVVNNQGVAALQNMEDMINNPSEKTIKMLRANLNSLIKRVSENAGISKPVPPEADTDSHAVHKHQFD